MIVMLGIDPGEATGVAEFRGGELESLRTVAPVDLAGVLMELRPKSVIYEDSRLQSRVWVPGATAGSKAKGMSIARDLGRVDARCADLVELCARLGILARGVSPRAKGAKFARERFAQVTGWTGSSNQHERDAAMVAWPYRKEAIHA